MSQKIALLSPGEAQKIAAGEVVERPANIAKELIENAIDAQASKIALHIKQGGQESIRIVDNGYGMNKEDATLCFERHATSKIQNVNQLESINTFGFRGEALASISAISIVTLQTKEKSAEHGIKLIRKNQTFIEEKPTACADGTDISIDYIFFNVPARKKFLKKKETEQRHITQLFHSFCLQHLNVHFSFYADGKQLFNCPAVKALKERMYQIWQEPLRSNIVTLEKTEKNNIHISGAITNHHYFRYDRNLIYLFVNNRWIKNHHVSRALLKGYLNVLPQGRYPAACIYITIDPTQIDINIHPRKEEVKFLHPRRVESLITQTVKTSLENNLSQQLQKEVTIAPATKTYLAPSFSSFKSRQSFINDAPIPYKNLYQSSTSRAIHNTPSFSSDTMAHWPEPITQQTTIEATTQKNIIGQLNKTYILVDHHDGLYVVDQHAAHERILYERFKKNFNNIPTTSLVFPHIITLNEHTMDLIEPHLNILSKHGLQIEPFGSNQLRVQATPVNAKKINIDDLIKEVISWIEEYQHIDEQAFLKKMHEHVHAQMACKAAVKAGNILDQTQMQELLYNLENTENRFTCPHGRPTGWLLSTHDIEKKFKRKL